MPDSIARVLSVYLKAISTQREQIRTLFNPFSAYATAVNSFLEFKSLELDIDGILSSAYPRSNLLHGGVYVRLTNGDTIPLTSLSSGERQILSLLFATNQASQNTTVLVDEPELSLHIDWQRSLLKQMMSQLSQSQIIVCTHSPEMGYDFASHYVELKDFDQ